MDLSDWLNHQGLGAYAAVFSNEGLDDLDSLRDLKEDDLEKLGLKMGPRKKLLKALQSEAASGAGESGALPTGEPKAAHRLKLFLSYGRDAHVAEVKALKAALESRGHEVWFDEEQLATGLDWELRIEHGLAWCDRVVLTMTPHAVRRPDGYCLNEIAKAMEQQKVIVPVLLAEVPDGAPTSICRIQYLDWRDAVPAAEKAERFAQRVERLCQALEEDKLDFEGGQQRLLRHLQPLNYDGDILHHVGRFQGRVQLFERIGNWLNDLNGAQCLWLQGPPGLGKSAIAATLAHRWGETGAMHFCVAGHQDKADPARALLSIAYQLSQRFDLYRQRLGQLELEREATKDARTIFDTLLVAPLARNFPAPERPCLIVIDALDEATTPEGHNPLAELVSTQWSRLPRWLRLMVTSRPDMEVRTWLQSLQTIALSGQDHEQLADLRAHVEQGLRILLTPGGRPVQANSVQRILDRSEGAFHYVSLLLDDVRDGRCDPDDPVGLPTGMSGYYRLSFRRRFEDAAAYRSEALPLLQLILAAPEPVPLAVLGTGTKRDPAAVRHQLAKLGSLIAIERADPGWEASWDTARVAHASLRSWLTDLDGETRMPTAGAFAAHPDTPGLAAAVLHHWEIGGSESRDETPPKRHGFIGRTVWNLLKAAEDRAGLDRVAFDVSLYWKPLQLSQALEPGEHAAQQAERAIDESETGKATRHAAIERAADCHQLLAWLYRMVGQSARALDCYQKAAQFGERLVEMEPESPRFLGRLAMHVLDLGISRHERGENAAALGLLRETCSLAEQATARDPEDSECYGVHAAALSWIGTLLADAGELEEALDAFRQSEAIKTIGAAKDPTNWLWQVRLGKAHLQAGSALLTQGHASQALQEARAAHHALSTPAARYPYDNNVQRSVGGAHQLTGRCLDALGEARAALEAFSQAREIAVRLLAQDPDAADVWDKLSSSHQRVADVLTKIGDSKAAAQEYGQALAIRQRLVDLDPDHAIWRSDLEATRASLATLAQAGR